MSFPVSKASLIQVRKARASKKVKGTKPQLTSLVDVMTILLIYLLQSFSTEGDIVTVHKNLVLPESSAQKKPELMVTIMVNNQFILAEGTPVAGVGDILTSDDLVIPELNSWLETRREATEKLSQYSSKVKFKGNVLIQGDRRIQFRLLKKIMYTCGQQGYNNFSLAVRKKGE